MNKESINQIKILKNILSKFTEQVNEIQQKILEIESSNDETFDKESIEEDVLYNAYQNWFVNKRSAIPYIAKCKDLSYKIDSIVMFQDMVNDYKTFKTLFSEIMKENELKLIYLPSPKYPDVFKTSLNGAEQSLDFDRFFKKITSKLKD